MLQTRDVIRSTLTREQQSHDPDTELSPKARAALEAGLRSAQTGETYYLGSFAQYADDE